MNTFIMESSVVRPATNPYGRLDRNSVVGYEGEHNSRSLVVETTDDLSAYASVSLIIDDLDCGAMTKTTSGSKTVLSLTLTSAMIGASGRKLCQLLMVDSNNTVIAKSSQFVILIKRSNDIERSVEDGVSFIIISEAVTEMAQEAASAAAEEAAADVVAECQTIANAAAGSASAAAQSAAAAQAAAKSIVVDSTLDTASTNAIQNKAVAGAISELRADLGDLSGLETTAKTNLVAAINEAAQSGGSGDGLTAEVKDALLACFANVAWKDDGGQTYYDDLYDALYAITAITLNANSISMQTIGATYQLTATTTPAGENVTWSSSNTSVATVSSTGLVTSVAYGSATITATAGNVSATCSVVVAQATCTGITASYTQSGTVYSDDNLDSLKSDLVVTAHYDNGTSQVLTDSAYTLTGNLNTATSIVTATFSGKTATFNVSVTLVGDVDYADDLSNWFLTQVTGAATYSDGKISIKGSQTNANAYKLLCFDRAKTLWDTVNGKKLRIRVTMDSPDWVGEISTTAPQNRVLVGVAIYRNSTITSGSDRLKTEDLNTQILPSSTPTTYEFIFDADVSNFSTGDGTPTNVSTFGVYIYNVSANTLEITDCSIVEVPS